MRVNAKGKHSCRETLSVTAPGLNRALGLRELVLYGIVLIQPTAPMPLYGVVCQQARGHVVTTILIGMVAMLFTAISYGRMARPTPARVPPTPTSAGNCTRRSATSPAGR